MRAHIAKGRVTLGGNNGNVREQHDDEEPGRVGRAKNLESAGIRCST